MPDSTMETSPELVTPSTSVMNLPQEDRVPASTGRAGSTSSSENNNLNDTNNSNNASRPARSTKGCLTCRARKVRCDERKPLCAKCAIKRRECKWPDPDAPVSRRHIKKRDPPMTLESLFQAPPYKRANVNTEATNSQSLTAIQNAFAQQNALAGVASSISPETAVFFNASNQDTSPLPDLSLWMNPFDTPPNPNNNSLFEAPSTILSDSVSTLPNLPFLHPLPSLEDIASWTFPANPPSSRLYVPPDFLPKSLTLPGKPKISLLPPKTKARMMADPSFMQPYFPSVDDRIIMRHYLLHTVHVIMAFECERQPWNPWVKIHAPLAFTHLPGVSPACDALRAAILCVGSVHLRHERYPNDKKAASKVVRASTAQVLDLVRQVIDAQTPTRPLETQDIEFIMAALLSCTIASSLAADGAWRELLDSVVDFIDRLGGAANLLQDSPRNKMSPLRFCCEQLAIRDVFGCFSTQAPPRILDTAFKPWFFESEAWSQNDDEWESVERMFGISRGMIDVMARACALIHKVQSTGQTLPEDAASVRSWTTSSEVSLRLPERAMARLSSVVSLQPEYVNRSASITMTVPPIDKEGLLAETAALVAEMTVWDQASNFSPVHPRTQYANHAYRHAIRIRLLREVFGASRRDIRVQNSTNAIIELATEVVAKFGKVSWLTWPVVIAGFHLFPNDPMRKVVSTLLTEFRRFTCFDAGAALDLLKDFWREDALVSTGTIPTQAVAKLMSKPFLD